MRQRKRSYRWRHSQTSLVSTSNYPPPPPPPPPPSALQQPNAAMRFLPFDFFGFGDLAPSQLRSAPPEPIPPLLYPLQRTGPPPQQQQQPEPPSALNPIVISDDEEDTTSIPPPSPPTTATTARRSLMEAGSTLETAINLDNDDNEEEEDYREPQASIFDEISLSLSPAAPSLENEAIGLIREKKEEDPEEKDEMVHIVTDIDDETSSECTESSTECLFGVAPIMTDEERALIDTTYESAPAQESWSLLAELSLEDKPMTMVKIEQDHQSDQVQLQLQQKQKQQQQQPDIMPPSNVKTKIPSDTQLSELLSRIDIYDESVRLLIAQSTTLSESSSTSSSSSLSYPNKPATRSRRAAAQRKSPAVDEQSLHRRPYVPGLLWRDSTWEDWAEFQVGDWLHWPFQEWEEKILEETVNQYGLHTRKRKIDGQFVFIEELWSFASIRLPGRRDIDCFRYWQDREVQYKDPYTKPVIISRETRTKQMPTKYEVISKARLCGRPNPIALKTAVWSDLRQERVFGGGSADTLAVQLVKVDNESFNVFASSACNSQLEYNMPGNLRVWSSKTDKVTQMEGHKIQIGSAQDGYQDLWTTVTDIKVSLDKRFIYSASHDKSARVWCAENFNLLSTLCFHENPVHQLALRTDTYDNIVASGSQDGTAVIWKLHESGNYGDGLVCEIDVGRFPEPSVECLAFGTGPSSQYLFTGVATNEREQKGYVYIQAFDANTSDETIAFVSMRGAVCDIDISSSGRYIASGNHSPFDDDSGDGFVHINDVRSLDSVIKAKTGHKDVNFVRMSPCERYVASGNPFNEVAVMDIRRPDRHLFTLRHDETIADYLVPLNSDMGIAGMHWMSDTPILVTAGGDSSVKLWNTQTGAIVKTYPTSSNVTSLHVDEETLTICAGVAGAQGYVHIFSP